jgi:hypothetical protein
MFVNNLVRIQRKESHDLVTETKARLHYVIFKRYARVHSAQSCLACIRAHTRLKLMYGQQHVTLYSSCSSIIIIYHFPYPTKWGRYSMFFMIVWKRFGNYFTTGPGGRTSTLLETRVAANDCKCSQDQQLNVPSEVRRGDQKFYYLELLRASEGTLSRWSRLHLQSLAPTNPH